MYLAMVSIDHGSRSSSPLPLDKERLGGVSTCSTLDQMDGGVGCEVVHLHATLTSDPSPKRERGTRESYRLIRPRLT